MLRGKFCGDLLNPSPPNILMGYVFRRPADDTYTNGLDEGETKNGVREELATERGVAGDGVDEGGEDETDTDTGTGKTNGSGTHTDVLGDLNKGVGHLRGVGALGLLGDGGGLGDLGALDGVEGGVLGDRCFPLYQYLFSSLLMALSPRELAFELFGASGELTRVGAGELLELSSLEGRAGGLHGGLGGHGGHLGGGDAEGRHCDGYEVVRWS